MFTRRRQTPQHNLNAQRPISNNFIPGGKLTAQPGPVQMPVQEQNFKKPQQQQQQLKPSNVQPALAEIKEVKPETGSDKSQNLTEKPKWAKGGKVSKKEKLKRRNSRLSKLLQPKNALMIVNELLQNPTFNVIDYVSVAGVQYKASVVIDGFEHIGFGPNKNAAKNAAAENALMSTFKSRMLKQKCSDAEKMDVDESDGSLPWQQIASFAMFKLFSSWGENPCAIQQDDGGVKPKDKLKPAKSLPDNAVTLNPVMLVNQMYPHAQFEELEQIGMPPNCLFNVKCTVDGQSFHGSGQSKKIAKKLAAYSACTTLLGLQYPPDVFVPRTQ